MDKRLKETCGNNVDEHGNRQYNEGDWRMPMSKDRRKNAK